MAEWSRHPALAFDVLGQGEVTVTADPTGATTGLCQPRPGWRFASHTPGTFAWAELRTSRGSAADDFYAQLVGLGSTQIRHADTYDTVRLGATVVAEPSDIPAGRIAALTDPADAHFALLTPAPRA